MKVDRLDTVHIDDLLRLGFDAGALPSQVVLFILVYHQHAFLQHEESPVPHSDQLVLVASL